jgi:hypothetical protein
MLLFSVGRLLIAPLPIAPLPIGRLPIGRLPIERLPIERLIATLVVGIGIAWGACAPVQAGLGPENLVVVVNASSADSRTIANHYVHLRQIPTRNVIFLDDVPGEMITTLEEFREKILKPVLAEIDSRGISRQIRAVAYSTHFPYAVKINQHTDRLEDATMKKIFRPVASINGLTYFFRFIASDREEYLSPGSNLYARFDWSRNFTQPFGDEDGELFDRSTAAMDEGDFATATEGFLKLFEKYPSQAPLGVLAARGLVGQDKKDAAMEQLSKAAVAGWSSGDALVNDAQLQGLGDRDDFQELVARLGDAPNATQHAIAFEALRAWSTNGWWNPVDQGGVSYLPSCMLAVTRGGGNTVDEAIAYLTTSAAADNTFPDGTVYYTITSDVRVKTRKPDIPDAMTRLRWLGRKTEMVKGKLPQDKQDVIGVTFGAAGYDWPASNSKFLPGAIGDNLTSTSGVMRGSNQTLLSELLKAGAAMASGTVTEPYALQFKFPLPQIHAYYAEGLTALEAYYLSLRSPYQLLIVGDPLCQPFAKQPAEIMTGKMADIDGKKALVMNTVLPRGTTAADVYKSQTSEISEVEIYVEGRLLQRGPAQENYTISLAGVAPGSYELRTVLVGEPRTAPRKTIRTWFDANGLYPTPVAKLQGDPVAADAEQVTINLNATGADSIRLVHFGQEQGKLDADSGDLTIDLSKLGAGPIRLRPVATYRGTDVAGREFTVRD